MADAKQIKKASKGMLFSRLSYAVKVRFDGQDCMVSPQAKLNVEDLSKLDMKSLPKGIIVRPIA